MSASKTTTMLPDDESAVSKLFFESPARALADAIVIPRPFRIDLMGFPPWVLASLVATGGLRRADRVRAPSGDGSGGAEGTATLAQELGAADVVIVGRMPLVAATERILISLRSIAQQAFLGLVPHPSLVRDPCFGRIARAFDYVQIDGACRSLLGIPTDDLLTNALRLRFLVRPEAECAVLNGAERGWMWAGNRWHVIDPVRDGGADDTDFEQAFGPAYVLGRHVLGLKVAAAIRYAVEVAGECQRPDELAV